MKINKNILIGIVLIFGIMLAVVTAELSTANRNTLISKNIAYLKVIEKDCPYNSNDAYNRCFYLYGDINKSLININTRVCDRFEYKNVTTIIRNRKINHIVKTGNCIYRTLTEKEVQSIIDKAVNKNIEDMDKSQALSTKPKTYQDKILIGK